MIKFKTLALKIFSALLAGFSLLAILWYIIYHDDGSANAFRYGLSPTQLTEFTESTKNGDAVAAYVITVHYDLHVHRDTQMQAEWAWYGLILDTSKLRYDKLTSLTMILASPKYPCPKRTQKELNIFFKHWEVQQTTEEIKTDIEEFRKKCSKE